ncbi:DUF5134 domain-containing protein [Kitasatospora sp. NPDC096147]|uniref:DUF5134 domain-containing protein n=1 Tax=Kitasatospora sp. NPDC096147 TaxID=3364093 RepID=UPI00380C1B4F
MHGPVLVSALLAAVTGGTAGYCLHRLRRGGWREADAAEAAMGLGMAGMALWPAPLWGWLFAALALALLAATALHRRHHGHRLHHALGSAAMAYLALAPGGHHGTAGLPALTGLLLLYYGGYTVWTGTRLLATPAGPVLTATTHLPGACRAAMGVGMFAMLLTM